VEADLERIERLLALILLHDLRDAPQAEKAKVLSRAAFSNKEIADLLGTSKGVVAQQLYELRRGGGKKRAKKASKRTRK
jgi:predicted transcriptional regulator